MDVPALKPLFGRPGANEAEVDGELRDRGIEVALHNRRAERLAEPA